MRVALVAVAIAVVLAGCGGDTYTPGDPTPEPDACEAEAGPFDLTLGGALAETITFELPSCVPAGEGWSATYPGSGDWELILDVPEPVLDELVTEGVSATLTRAADPIVWSAAAGTFEAQRFEPPEPPCGEWTVNALDDGEGAFVTVSPQPIPLRCG